MAKKDQKSQAQKAASAAKSKSKNTNKKEAAGKKTAAVQPEKQETKIPVRLISSLVFLACFILFAIILFACEGALLKFLEKLIHGLIGRISFIIMIPVLLYLFYIHAFSGKRPVAARTAYLIFFVLLCGCISHLNDIPQTLPKGLKIISVLYNNGLSGTNGGVICGLIAQGIHWLCGGIVSYILMVVLAVLALLGGMNITVRGLVKAYRERPRAQWEEEEEAKEKEEPSAVVVNHIAT